MILPVSVTTDTMSMSKLTFVKNTRRTALYLPAVRCSMLCFSVGSGLYMTRLRVMDQTQLTGSVSRVDSTHRRCESS
jgi:hypothetical protein